MTHLAVGDDAPAFEAEDETGRTWTLDDLAEAPFVLYFYPRDDTPGCTTEAISFRDAMPRFDEMDATVLGVSDDDADSHQAFKEKHDLDFPLLVDEGGDLADAYGVWVEKKMFGNEFFGNQRATFLVGPDGKIAHVWPDVDPEGHADEVLDALATLDA